MSDEPHTGPDMDEVKEGAANVGRGLLWIVIVLLVAVVVISIFLLGPIGLFVVVPAVLVVWLLAAGAAGGPAVGA